MLSQFMMHMVQAQAHMQHCSSESTPFDVEGSSAMIFERLRFLALHMSSANVSSPHFMPFYLAQKRWPPFSPKRRHQITAMIGDIPFNSDYLHLACYYIKPQIVT